MTDRYLIDLWSKAVRTEKGEFCYNPECDKQASGMHHILKRKWVVTRYKVQNGIPLCPICHPKADRNSAWALSMVPQSDRDYLARMGIYTMPEWLKINGLSRAEFEKQEADTLKEIIRKNK